MTTDIKQPTGKPLRVSRMKFTEMAGIPSLDIMERVPTEELERLCETQPMAMAQLIIDLLDRHRTQRELNQTQANRILALTNGKP